jgi:hypothetical protein
MQRRRKNKEEYKLLPEPEFLPQREKVRGLSVWKDEYVRLAFYMALLGATDRQLSQVFDVSPQTIENWKHKKDGFLDALRQGKLEADGAVVHSMFQVSCGYSHPDEVILSNRCKEYDPKTGKLVREWTEPLRVPITKHYPPNVKAGLKWLAARHPETWGNKVEVKGKIDVTHKVDLSKFSDEELKVLQKLGVQKEENVEDTEFEEINGNNS